MAHKLVVFSVVIVLVVAFAAGAHSAAAGVSAKNANDDTSPATFKCTKTLNKPTECTYTARQSRQSRATFDEFCADGGPCEQACPVPPHESIVCVLHSGNKLECWCDKELVLEDTDENGTTTTRRPGDGGGSGATALVVPAFTMLASTLAAVALRA